MLANSIFTIGKTSGQGCRAGIEGEVSRDSDFVEGPSDQRKEFLGFCRLLFCGTTKLSKPWNPLFRFHLALPPRLNKLITIGTTDARIACFLFLLGHFQTNEAKFETFAYNSKTVKSSYIKI